MLRINYIKKRDVYIPINNNTSSIRIDAIECDGFMLIADA